MTDAAGSLVAECYRLVQVIGTGGMGRVWLGRDEVIGREVAIKYDANVALFQFDGVDAVVVQRVGGC